jgi:hypothetical protein
MNNTNPPSASVPPQIPALPVTLRLGPLGEKPEEREPITSPVAAVEAILRQPRRVIFQLRQPRSGVLLGVMVLVAMFCSLVYGVVVGSFSMGEQLWAAPVKIAAGLMIAGLICLPSLYIFTCLSGSQAKLAEMCGLAAGLVMLMTLLLIGFAPVAWLFSQSTQSVAWMGALHLVFLLIATAFGVRFLLTGFSHSQVRSRASLYLWILIFMLVVLQMTTALRPLVGKAEGFLPKEKMFFLAHWGDCLKAEPQPTHNPSR